MLASLAHWCWLTSCLSQRLCVQSAERLVASSKELAGAVGASREALLEEALLEQVAVSERLTHEVRRSPHLLALRRGCWLAHPKLFS